MDLFLKLSVLQANFCWLGDLEKMICPWKESIGGGGGKGQARVGIGV